jgi:hypothetical protein
VAWLKGSEVNGYVEIDRKIKFMQDIQFMGDNLLGDTFYVRNSGSDSANGKSVSKAFKTLSTPP